MSDFKKCLDCGALKEKGDFYKHKNYKDGLMASCKECICKCRKIYRDNNKEIIHNRNIKYKEKNFAKIAEYQKDYYNKNSDKKKANRKKWVVNNRDKINLISKRYQVNNPDKIRERNRKYRLNNPEKRLAQRLADEAVRRGDIKIKPCEVCGTDNVHKHHEDYNNPLDVTFLCCKHHSQVHHEKRRD